MRGGESLLPMPPRVSLDYVIIPHLFEFGIFISFESRYQYAKKKKLKNKAEIIKFSMRVFNNYILKFPSEGLRKPKR